MAKFITTLERYVGSNIAKTDSDRIFIIDPITLELIEKIKILRYCKDEPFSALSVYEGQYGKFINTSPEYLRYNDISFGDKQIQPIEIPEVKIKPGDNIHLNTHNGMYRVVSVHGSLMKLYSSTRGEFTRSITEYKCHAGGLHNFRG